MSGVRGTHGYTSFVVLPRELGRSGKTRHFNICILPKEATVGLHSSPLDAPDFRTRCWNVTWIFLGEV